MNHNERRDMPIIIGIAIAVLLAVILGRRAIRRAAVVNEPPNWPMIIGGAVVIAIVLAPPITGARPRGAGGSIICD